MFTSTESENINTQTTCDESKNKTRFNDIFTNNDNQSKLKSTPETSPHLQGYFKIIEIDTSTQNQQKLIVVECVPGDSSDLSQGQGENKEPQIYPKSKKIVVTLINNWCDCIWDVNDKIFLSVATYDENKNSFIVSNHTKLTFTNGWLDNILILEPEVLLSPTQIKNGVNCLRQAILREQFNISIRQNSTLSFLAIIGNVLHAAFEKQLLEFYKYVKTGLDRNKLITTINEILEEYALDMIVWRESKENVFKSCMGFLNQIIDTFSILFCDSSCNSSDCKVSNTIGCEKLYQSPSYGIRGWIDAIVSTKQKPIVPFEIKTGKPSDMDKMQVCIYSMILTEFFKSRCDFGIISYWKSGEIANIDIEKYKEILHISIITRNNIVKNIKKAELGNEIMYKQYNTKLNRDCRWCFSKEICFSLNRVYEDDIRNVPNVDSLNGDNGEMPKEIKEYFKYNYELMNNEQKYFTIREKKRMALMKTENDLYISYNIACVEERNLAFIFDLEKPVTMEDVSKNSDSCSRYIISQFSEISDNFIIYEPVTKKEIKGIIISKPTPNRVTISVLKHYLSNTTYEVFHRWDNRDIAGKQLYLRVLDTYSKYSFNIFRGNLLTLCCSSILSNDNQIIMNLQQNWIFKQRPQFETSKEFEDTLTDFINKNYQIPFSMLNRNQQIAIMKSIACTDYCLIKGYPGTGKTMFIALWIDMWSNFYPNARILFASHTNTAVDNTCIKWQNNSIEFKRITNNVNSVNKEVLKNVVTPKTYATYDQWNQFYSSTRIYATTCLGVANKIFTNMEFDYTIIDEVCQAHDAELLGPLLLSRKFILVGDPNQLGALLLSEQNKYQGKSQVIVDEFHLTQNSKSINEGIFQRLTRENNEYADLEEDAGPVTEFTCQYRMNGDILELSNECVYNNKMKCGSKHIEKLVCKFRNFLNIKTAWVNDIFQTKWKVVFVDYMNTVEDSVLKSSKDSNVKECELIEEIIREVKTVGYNTDNIGIITPYKAQELMLRKYLKGFNQNNIYTIDKSQGSEKDIIILSFVKTDNNTKLLSDWARINVAFTRAKMKLIIIGLKDVLIQMDEIKKYIEIIVKNNWVYELRV